MNLAHQPPAIAANNVNKGIVRWTLAEEHGEMRKYLLYYMSVDSYVSETCVLHVRRIKDFSKEHKNNHVCTSA